MNTLTSISEKSQFNSNDKLALLTIQKAVSVVGLLFSIVLATNLFLLEHQQVSTITRYLAWTSVAAAILFLASVAWAFQTERKIREVSSESSDNVFTRVVLFLSILIGVQFTIYYIVYEFASDNLSWYVQSQSSEEQRQEYLESAESKQGWIEFLSISIILFLLYTIFSTFANGGSRITCNLQVYLVGIALAVTSFYQLYTLREVESTYHNTSGVRSVDWGMTFWITIVALVMLCLTFLANAKRVRLALLILGTFFIFVTALFLPIVGDYFETYDNLDNTLSEQGALQSIDAKYIESHGCPNKYQYSPTGVKCPSAEDAQECFADPFNCLEGNSQTQVWEKYLLPTETTTAYACLNVSRCSGVARVLYSEPILRQAIFALQFAFYSFILGAFCYQLSAQERGSQIVNSQVQLALMGLFVVVVIVGSIFQVVGLHGITSQPANQQVLNIQEQTLQLEFIEQQQQFQQVNQSTFYSLITQDTALQGYAADSGCDTLNDLLQTSKAKFTTAISNTTVSSLDDLNVLLHVDQVPANNQCQTSNGQQVVCNQPGYLVVIQGPAQGSGCTAQPQFIYEDLHNNQHSSGVRFVAPTTALSLFEASSTANTDKLDSDAVAALAKNSYIAFAGDNAAVQKYLKQVTVCDLTKCQLDQLNFVIRVVKLDIEQFYTAEHVGEEEEQQGKGRGRGNGRRRNASKGNNGRGHAYGHNHDLEDLYTDDSLIHDAAKPKPNPKDKNTKPDPKDKNTKPDPKDKNTKPDPKDKNTKPDPKDKNTKPNPKDKNPKDKSGNKPGQGNKPTKDNKPQAKPNNSQFDIWGNQQMTVQVWDTINDKPLVGAKVRAYRVADNTAYDGLCQQVFDYQPDLNATSASSGLASTRILYGPSVADSAATIDGDNYITYYIEAQLEGYHTNCRQYSFGYQTLPKNYPVLRVGLTPQLQELQARAVLEWDNQFVGDLHLWASFSGNDQDGQAFDCIVGPFNQECQSVLFHESQNPSESTITFSAVGQYDYLVYFNRLINNIAEKQRDGRVKTFAGDILAAGQNGNSINPIVKYYTGQASKPAWASQNDLINQGDLDKLDEVKKNDETNYITTHNVFSYLEFCLNVRETHSLKPVEFTSANSLWSRYQGLGQYTTVATKSLFPDSDDLNDSQVNICQQLNQQQQDQGKSKPDDKQKTKPKPDDKQKPKPKK